MNLQPFIDRAVVELERKTLNDIQVETALTWAGRSCAAAMNDNLADAIEYAHEAIEHAALSGHGALLDEIRTALERCGVPLFQQVK